MTMLNDAENSSGAAAAQEDGGQDFTPFTITEEQLVALAQTLSEAFVTNFVTAVVAQKEEAIALLQQAGVDSTATFRAAKLLGAGAGNIMLALEVAEAVQNGATDPDAMISGLAGIALYELERRNRDGQAQVDHLPAESVTDPRRRINARALIPNQSLR